MIKFKQMASDPTLQKVHENLQRIMWILDHKRPYPGDEKLNPDGSLMGDGKNPFEDLFGKGFGL